jgi:hypothetical protein
VGWCAGRIRGVRMGMCIVTEHTTLDTPFLGVQNNHRH